MVMSPSTIRDTIWYASARAREEGHDKRVLADSVEYGAAIYDRTNPRDPFTSALQLTLRDSIRYTREAFISVLAQRVTTQPAPNDLALVYVHGFGTGLGECWSNPMQARIRSGSAVPWIAYCWPSHGAGITWPRGGSLVVRAYEEDTAAVVASVPLFRQVLDAVIAAIGAPRVVLTAHSLGARLVGEVLTGAETRDSFPLGRPAPAQATGLPDPKLAEPLRALAFLAPDLEAMRFADTLLPQLRPSAQRIVLYSSRRDRALTISRRMHDSPRAGLAEPTPVLRAGLETVDMTEGLNADGWWQRHFGNHHSIRRISGVMWDLVHVVGGEFAASCRERLGYGVLETNGSWRLLAGLYPDATQLSACARRRSIGDTISQQGPRSP
ncbi:hypothetical protein GEMMAAP_05535 [Gemmatimonas phototrophica]|uniref:Uncharacterized protein n=2 Tax=Gemmatimonas phototrophica TaxID=1379270 RepID=A0A143BHE5_9BACT|nr:hypothetical protein GEMMAAP_05535 [Gemmatimonas phototrophica]